MKENYTFPNEIFGSFLNALKAQVTTSLLLVLILAVLYMLFVKNGFKKLPGPIGLLFFGYWPFLTKDPHVVLNQLAKKYGNVFGIRLGRKYAVVCNDYETMKDALGKTECITRPPGIFSSVPLGIGFGDDNVLDWSTQRRFCVKAMRVTGLGSGSRWEELLQEEVGEVVERIHSSQGQPIEVDAVLAGTFTNIGMDMLFGHRRTYDEVKRLDENMTIAMDESPALDPCIFLPSTVSALIKPRKTKDRIKEFPVYLQKCIEEVLQSKEMFKQNSFVKFYFQKIQENEKKQRNSFTDANLLRNTQTLVIGSRTISKTFHWLLVAMAEHPEKQLKVHQELDAKLGKGRTADSVPYTFAAVLESMRWRTLVPLNALRVFSKDTTLQGYKITKGMLLVTNFWAAHNDTKYWKDPELFEPERFLTEDKMSVIFKPESFVPFSLGRRNCPGEKLALSTILTYFATIMQNFTILLKEGDNRVEGQYSGTSWQAKGVRLRFIARDQDRPLEAARSLENLTASIFH